MKPRPKQPPGHGTGGGPGYWRWLGVRTSNVGPARRQGRSRSGEERVEVEANGDHQPRPTTSTLNGRARAERVPGRHRPWMLPTGSERARRVRSPGPFERRLRRTRQLAARSPGWELGVVRIDVVVRRVLDDVQGEPAVDPCH